MDGDIPNVQKLFIIGDKNKLSQVARNLMSNALKFTPKNGVVTVKVSLLRTRKEGQSRNFNNSFRRFPVTPLTSNNPDSDFNLTFVLEVSDSGAGITAVILITVIFLSFYGIIDMNISIECFRRISRGCSKRSFSSTPRSCRKAKALELDSGVSFMSYSSSTGSSIVIIVLYLGPNIVITSVCLFGVV